MWNVVSLCLVAQVPPASPAELVSAAYADVQKLPAEIQCYTRYLMRPPEWSDEDWKYMVPALRGWLNHLNRTSETAPVIRIGDLLRLNTEDFGWDAATWEKQEDPFLTVPVIVGEYAGPHVSKVEGEWSYWTGGICGKDHGGDGRDLRPGWYKGISRAVTGKTARSRGIDQDFDVPELAKLIGATHSKVPIVSAGYFFKQSSAVFGRTPNYYDWLRVKTQQDVEDLAGLDRKRVRRKTELRESMGKSGVSNQPRAIVREIAEGDAFWQTFDFAKVREGVNPLETLGRDIFKIFKAQPKTEAATEIVFDLPSGHKGYALANNEGELQDRAPDFVGRDSMSVSNDGRIHNPFSCIRCHDDGGLKDFKGWARSRLPALGGTVKDYHEAQLLKAQYLKKLEPALKRDREAFATALSESCGLAPKEFSKRIAELWGKTQDQDYNLALAAKTLRCTPEKLRKALEYQKAAKTLNPMASAFLPPEEPLPSEQFEDIHYLLRAYVRTTK